ncbi:MAG: transporter substrate-binding domain-containing protein [Oscillospiraceae bacterium]|nr:transporter substrate-binding domain-containing protein [Oscillospiraceae bacterium]
MKNKGWIWGLLLAFCALTALSACGGKAAMPKDRLDAILERGSITIATEGDWVPWTYHDASDVLVGYDVEIGERIAAELGVKAEFAETDWDSILAGVDSGRFDIACNGVDITPERSEKYAFSTPYIYPDAVLVVRSDNEDIHSLEDLAGRTTANSPSSTYADMALEYGAEVTYVSTLNDTVQMLEQGRVEATINAQGSIRDYMEQHPDANIKIVQVIEGVPAGVPMQKGEDSASLVEAVNGVLEKMRSDGTLAELSVKYFGVDLTKKN